MEFLCYLPKCVFSLVRVTVNFLNWSTIIEHCMNSLLTFVNEVTKAATTLTFLYEKAGILFDAFSPTVPTRMSKNSYENGGVCYWFQKYTAF